MDEVAKQIGMDPVEFRRRNFIKKGETLIQRQPIPTSTMLPELLEEAQRIFGKKAGPDSSKSRGPWRRGVGYIANIAGYGRPGQEGETYPRAGRRRPGGPDAVFALEFDQREPGHSPHPLARSPLRPSPMLGQTRCGGVDQPHRAA